MIGNDAIHATLAQMIQDAMTEAELGIHDARLEKLIDAISVSG